MYIYVYILNIYIIYIYYCGEEDNAKQLYLVFKVSYRRTDNLSARYNDHQKIYSLCRVHLHSFRSLSAARNHYLP